MKRILLYILTIAFISCSPDVKESLPLKNAYKEKFTIGVALHTNIYTNRDPKAASIAKMHFNSATSENDMKWERIHPEPGVYNFKKTDQFVEFCEENNMEIIGHVLVWHSQTPDWVFHDKNGNRVSRDTLLARMKDHIFTVMGRYKGRIHAWDVVNEALHEDGTIRDNIWYEIIGEDYIEKAFKYAAEADPDAILIYNDFSLPKPEKAAGVVRLIGRLLNKGIKVDAIGMQGHYLIDFPTIENLEASIDTFSSLGVKVMISELDISVLPNPYDHEGADISKRFELTDKLNPYPHGCPDSMQVALTKKYVDLFRVFVEHQEVISRVTFWGINDQYSWRNYYPVKGRTDYPLLFDRNYKAKPVVKELTECCEQ